MTLSGRAVNPRFIGFMRMYRSFSRPERFLKSTETYCSRVTSNELPVVRMSDGS